MTTVYMLTSTDGTYRSIHGLFASKDHAERAKAYIETHKRAAYPHALLVIPWAVTPDSDAGYEGWEEEETWIHE